MRDVLWVYANGGNMGSEIIPITTPFILNVTVSCYLVRSAASFVLIDTGPLRRRGFIEKELEKAGCKPGNLKLILLTHGDFDHCGNAAYLREKFGTKIALHEGDSGMVEWGDMTWNRTVNIVLKTLLRFFVRLRKSDRFRPDFYITEDSDFSEYGFDAKAIYLPGHSRGSVGFLTAEGDLFCGDLLANVDKPDVWTVVDDQSAMKASVERLNSLTINTIYPGHGKPFPMAQFREIAKHKNM